MAEGKVFHNNQILYSVFGPEMLKATFNAMVDQIAHEAYHSGFILDWADVKISTEVETTDISTFEDKEEYHWTALDMRVRGLRGA